MGFSQNKIIVEQSSYKRVILSDNLACSGNELSVGSHPSSRVKHLEAIRGSLLAKWSCLISKLRRHLIPFFIIITFWFLIKPGDQKAYTLKLLLIGYTLSIQHGEFFV